MSRPDRRRRAFVATEPPGPPDPHEWIALQVTTWFERGILQASAYAYCRRCGKGTMTTTKHLLVQGGCVPPKTDLEVEYATPAASVEDLS